MSDHNTQQKMSAEDVSEVRELVRAVMSAEGLTQVTVATESGIPYGTLTPFMTNKYQGDCSKVAASLQMWIESRGAHKAVQHALQAVPDFQLTPTAESFFSAFSYAQHMPDMVVICGGPGVGKTMSCHAYSHKSPNVWIVTASPTMTTPRALLTEVADALGFVEKVPAARIFRALVKRLMHSNGLLIVDEAQHLSTQAVDQIRGLHDQANVGIALVGNETVHARLEGEGRQPKYAQLYSRIGMKVQRKKPLRADIEMMLDAWNIGGDKERKLLRAIASDHGALRGMTKCIKLALMQSDGTAPLDGAAIQRAWARLSDRQLGEAA